MNSSLLMRIVALVAIASPTFGRSTDCNGDEYVSAKLSDACCIFNYAPETIPNVPLVDGVYLAPAYYTFGIQTRSLGAPMRLGDPLVTSSGLPTEPGFAGAAQAVMHDRHENPGFWKVLPGYVFEDSSPLGDATDATPAGKPVTCDDSTCKGLSSLYFYNGLRGERTATATAQVEFEYSAPDWYAPMRVVQVESCHGGIRECGALRRLSSWFVLGQCPSGSPQTCLAPAKAAPTNSGTKDCLESQSSALDADWYPGNFPYSIGETSDVEPPTIETACPPLN